MRLALKLSILLAVASAGPLLLTTWVSVPRSADALEDQLQELFRANAEALARETDELLKSQAGTIAGYARAVDFAELDEADEEGFQQALSLVLEQTRDATVAVLVDETGRAVTTPVGDTAALDAFGQNIPFAEALNGTAALIGPPYLARDASGREVPRVAMAVPARSPAGKRWVLAVEVALSSVAERIDRFRLGQTGRASLLDGTGRQIWGSSVAAGAARMHASAQVPTVRWRVEVDQSSAEALAPIRQQYRDAVLWASVGLLLALAIGFTAVRAVTRPLSLLESAVGRVERGDLEAQVSVRSGDEIGRVGRAFNTMVAGLRERERLKQSFSRYMSQAVADRILSESSDLDVDGEQVDATVMFLDIRGFTQLAERLPPQEVVALLNDYFDLVVRVVLRYEGVVLKYIGDAVMVMFGIPRELPEPEFRAVCAALDVQSAAEALSRQRVAAGREVAHFGIAINTGPVIAGNIGSSQRLEYTLIGDAVNVASRLQAFAGPGEVVISLATRNRIAQPLRVESRGEVKVRGKQQTVAVLRVLGREDARQAS